MELVDENDFDESEDILSIDSNETSEEDYFPEDTASTGPDSNEDNVESTAFKSGSLCLRNRVPAFLDSWLKQFLKWSPAERWLAMEHLKGHCTTSEGNCLMEPPDPTRVDFLSLLPLELSLYVISFLTPKDVVRVGCVSHKWRSVADNELVWKKICTSEGITADPNQMTANAWTAPLPLPMSMWRTVFMRNHIIIESWRSAPVRLSARKAHTSHMITALLHCEDRIVTASNDGTLKVWSARTGKPLRSLRGHTSGVWCAAMNDTVVVSGSTDRTLRVWNTESGMCVHLLRGHTSTVRCMDMHGDRVVSGSRDTTLRLWNINLGICLRVFEGHMRSVRCVKYDGHLIVSGSYDFLVKVWHPGRSQCLRTLLGHASNIYSLQFDGTYVISSSLDTTIRVWNVHTGVSVHTLSGHLSLSSTTELRGKMLVSGNADCTAKIWDISTGHCLRTLLGPNQHKLAVTSLQFNHAYVVSSSDDGTVKLWDLHTGQFIRDLVTLESANTGAVVWRIKMTDTKLFCAVGSRGGRQESQLIMVDFISGKPLQPKDC